MMGGSHFAQFDNSQGNAYYSLMVRDTDKPRSDTDKGHQNRQVLTKNTFLNYGLNRDMVSEGS